jgi:hypothetical protein
MGQWRMQVPDKYPASMSWATFEQIQTILRHNHAEYDRNKTRGVPRPGKALSPTDFVVGEESVQTIG